MNMPVVASPLINVEELRPSAGSWALIRCGGAIDWSDRLPGHNSLSHDPAGRFYRIKRLRRVTATTDLVPRSGPRISPMNR